MIYFFKHFYRQDSHSMEMWRMLLYFYKQIYCQHSQFAETCKGLHIRIYVKNVDTYSTWTCKRRNAVNILSTFTCPHFYIIQNFSFYCNLWTRTFKLCWAFTWFMAVSISIIWPHLEFHLLLKLVLKSIEQANCRII